VRTVAVELLFALIYAVALILEGPTGVSLLLCALVGAVLRLRFDRDSAIFIGNVVVASSWSWTRDHRLHRRGRSFLPRVLPARIAGAAARYPGSGVVRTALRAVAPA
jgi:hypothetical protein